ncbi:hypothetical protein BH24ACT5_BH24ACT5_22600 [soil metagenome]
MSDTEDGQWTIFHPGELIATFLLPLPDPIPLPDGAVLPTYRPMEHAAIQVLEPWLDEMWLQRLDGSAIAPCNEMRTSGGDEPALVNWSNKFTLVASIQFHQTFSDARLRLGLEPAMSLAEVISGPRLTSEDKARATDDISVASYLDTSGLREMGLGAVTVAECYVGLRIVGDLPELESPLTQGIVPEPPFGPLEADRVHPDEIAIWQWRVFPSGTAAGPGLVERRMRNALEIALTELRSIQRAVQALRRTPTMITARERLPVLVPVVLRLASDIGDETKPPLVVLLAPHPNIEPLLPPDPFTDDDMQAISKARQRVDDGPFSAHRDVHREAHIALDRLGDHRLAALLFGIAAESLFDELILHLMWEERLTPEHAAQNWVEGLDTRVRQELPTRLGGPWDVTHRHPIGVWAQDVASLRHRVAHAAYMPAEEEARRSYYGVNALVTHLCDRLTSPEVLKKYPRTALTLAGERGLRRRNAYTNRIRGLENDPSEVLWAATFYRWREAWRRTRQDQTVRPRLPNELEAWLLAVRHPNRTLRWIRHDRAQHLAIEVGVNENDLIPGFIDQIHAIADVQQQDNGYPLPISTSHLQVVRTTYRPGALWVEDYHHVPMTEVMVDGSDYRQLVGLGLLPAQP